MIADVDGQSIALAPATEIEEIVQNVAMIITTPRGSCVLNRAFGVDRAALDRPINAARDALTADIIESVQRWEPRARVLGVTWTGAADAGIVQPTVRIQIDG